MTRRQFVFTTKAQRQIGAAARWWRRNRDKAPDAFPEDLLAGYRQIRTNPEAGEPFRGDIRRLLLARIRYHLYYRVAADGEIQILSLWHTSRGTAPRL